MAHYICQCSVLSMRAVFNGILKRMQMTLGRSAKHVIDRIGTFDCGEYSTSTGSHSVIIKVLISHTPTKSYCHTYY